MTARSDIVLRSYESQDLDAIVELDTQCFEPPFRFSSAAMRRFAEAKNAWVVVAESEGAVAGFCIVHLERAETLDVGYVVTIDVAPGFRRRGLGEEMLAVGEAWVRASGGAGIMLHVFVKNDAAIRFYERLGYKRVGGQRGFYGPGIDAAMYWKEFSDT